MALRDTAAQEIMGGDGGPEFWAAAARETLSLLTQVVHAAPISAFEDLADVFSSA
jgi:hypothetical protein